MLFTDIITIYNHRPDDSYLRTVINGVQYSKKTEKSISTDGKINLGFVVHITIPDSAKSNRAYADKKTFQQDAERRYYTLDDSGNLDIVVQGEIMQEITEGYRLKDLKSDYDCVTVASVADNRNRGMLSHIKVVCK